MKALPPGAKAQIFGAMLVALALMVLLLSQLLGFALDPFYWGALVGGGLLVAWGRWRQRRGMLAERTSGPAVAARSAGRPGGGLGRAEGERGVPQ